MKRQKFFGVLSLIFGIALLLGCGARVLAAEQKNKPLTEAFKPNTTVESWQETIRQLQNKTPLEQIDLYTFVNFAPQDRAMVCFTGGRLHTTLHYYAHPGDLVPALTLKAGTVVSAGGPIKENEEDMYRWIYYGTDYSFPAYQAGWRYTRAYQPGGDPEAPKFYYIRTEELKKEFLAGLYEWFDREAFSEEEQNEKCQESLDESFYVMDNKLYARGIYISPDLKAPLWDEGNTVLFTTGTALCLLGLVLLIHFKHFKKNRAAGSGGANP